MIILYVFMSLYFKLNIFSVLQSDHENNGLKKVHFVDSKISTGTISTCWKWFDHGNFKIYSNIYSFFFSYMINTGFFFSSFY